MGSKFAVLVRNRREAAVQMEETKETLSRKVRRGEKTCHLNYTGYLAESASHSERTARQKDSNKVRNS